MFGRLPSSTIVPLSFSTPKAASCEYRSPFLTVLRKLQLKSTPLPRACFWLVPFGVPSNDASDVDGLTALSTAVKATEAKREFFTKSLLPLTLKRSFHSLAQIKSDDDATLKLAKLNGEDLVQLVSRRHSILFSQEREPSSESQLSTGCFFSQADMHIHAALKNHSYKTQHENSSSNTLVASAVTHGLCPNHSMKSKHDSSWGVPSMMSKCGQCGQRQLSLLVNTVGLHKLQHHLRIKLILCTESPQYVCVVRSLRSENMSSAVV